MSNGDRVSVWEDEKALEMLDGSDGYTTMGMSLMPPNLKMVKMVNLCVLPQFLKRK